MNHESKVLRYARKYTRWGWHVVPVPHRQKAPRLREWQKLRLDESELSKYFDEDANIGVLLGEPSKGLVDVDLDCPEALVLGPTFLPPTCRIHGRNSKPGSHPYYYAKPIPAPEKFCDVDGTCLAELRATGQQTLVPPSIHPTGERLRWESRRRSASVDGAELRTAVARLSAAALFARHWPGKGRRNEAALALAGILLRAEWGNQIEVGELVGSVALAAGDEEWMARKAVARTTQKRLDDDREATGRPRLAELLGADVVDRACEWLGIGDSRPLLASVRATGATWPEPLAEEAFHALAGEILRTIGPETEGDPAALLLQLLAAFGNVVGRQPHFKVGAAVHHTNLFCVVVGRTAKSRKGTSWAEVERLSERVDPTWVKKNVLPGGLSSGEGLVWAVRDAVEKQRRVKKDGKTSYETVIVDEGVTDKRLLVLETEFASPLRMIRREGNVLSAVIRRAWDKGDLSIITKNFPARATDAHISISGHITRDELLREFSAIEGSSGFANRFLFGCAKRSGSLPLGGQVPKEALDALTRRLREAVAFARKTSEMRFSKQARELWCQVYPGLTAEAPGLLGAITARAEAQVLRLSMVYALLECSSIITTKHLRAALALWRYCEDSARYIFGDAFGDPVVDQLLRSLRKSPKGLTRTQIREVFSRNRSETEISNGLRVLFEYGLVRFVREETGGRPSERWFATR